MYKINIHTQHKRCEKLFHNPVWRVAMTNYVCAYNTSLFKDNRRNSWRNIAKAITTLQSGIRPIFSQPLCMCVNFMHKWRGTYSSKSTPIDRFLRSFFMLILFNLRVFARNLLRWNRRRNIFILMSELGFELGPCI